MKKALIAMSGGVDSSVAALLMQKSGYDCIGATMRLFDTDAQNGSDAANVSKTLGMEHITLDFRGEFRNEVIERFIRAYENGNTPNPCIECNRFMKFGRLLKSAEDMNCSHIATGHYARVRFNEASGRYELLRAKDLSKDQSYVLCLLTQRQLSRTVLPLGEFSKTEVRAAAAEHGFSNADRRDSQDICFVPDGDYAGFIEKERGHTFPAGAFTDRDGRVIGTHSGIIRYTVGQRKGLGSFGKPMFVCGKCARDNTVILGDNADLFSKTVFLGGFNWVSRDYSDGAPFRCTAKLRYNQTAQPALAQAGENGVTLTFDEPQRAAAAGQFGVLYDGDIVIGGGTIL